MDLGNRAERKAYDSKAFRTRGNVRQERKGERNSSGEYRLGHHLTLNATQPAASASAYTDNDVMPTTLISFDGHLVCTTMYYVYPKRHSIISTLHLVFHYGELKINARELLKRFPFSTVLINQIVDKRNHRISRTACINAQ